jgi:hypothetical protein
VEETETIMLDIKLYIEVLLNIKINSNRFTEDMMNCKNKEQFLFVLFSYFRNAKDNHFCIEKFQKKIGDKNWRVYKGAILYYLLHNQEREMESNHKKRKGLNSPFHYWR